MVLLFSCQKEEIKVEMLANPIVPTIQTVPNLTFQRTNGLDTIVFVGTVVNPGFNASANYFLEVDTAGDQFNNAVVLASGIQELAFKFTVSNLNGLLIRHYPADTVSQLEFRIRSVLVQDAGTGYVPKIYVSPTQSASVTIYGLPHLDLIGSGITQKIESALGDGNYTGFVKLDATKPFTLNDPDANVTYGLTAGVLAAGGTGGITAASSGWYILTVSTTALTYSMTANMIGLIGDFNGWASPDQKLDYNSKGGYWYTTASLIVGGIKFRMNDSWSGGYNIGYGDASDPQYDFLNNLWNNSSSGNIPITVAGTYYVTLTIGSPIVCSLTLQGK